MSDQPENPFLKGGAAPQAPQPTQAQGQQAGATDAPSPAAGTLSSFGQSPFVQPAATPPMPQNAPQGVSTAPPAQSPFAQPVATPSAAPATPHIPPAQPSVPPQPAMSQQISQPQAPHAAPQAPQIPQANQSHAGYQPQPTATNAGQSESAHRTTAIDSSALSAGTKRPSPFDFAGNGGGKPPASSDGGASSGGPAGSRAQVQRYSALQFTGGVGAYYGIVIVNMLLSLLTLGLWGPWAKVRTIRFFYGNTEFLEEGFEFLATGKQLFIGRLIAFIALVALGFFELVPVIGPVLSVLLFTLAVPFVLNRSLGFKARYLTWRDVRFDWHGTFGKAFVIFMIYPLLSVLTLGLLQPIAARALRQHYVDNHAFGAAPFQADLPLGAFYLALIKGLVFFLVMGALIVSPAVFAAYSMLLNTGLFDVTSTEEFYLLLALLDETQQAIISLPFFAFFFVAYMTSGYYFALVRHIMVAHASLAGGIRMRSSLSSFRFAYILFTNLILNIVTLGFAHPYTVIRRYRYLTETIEVRPIADMRGFIDHQKKSGFSIFEEATEIEGLSIDV